MDVVDKISIQLPGYTGNGADDESIRRAESLLQLKFSDEYCKYLKAYGTAAVNGHEFTGICLSKWLDVVAVTLSERERKHHIPDDFYVLEQLNIDDAVVWQSSKGAVYQTVGDSEPVKICDSFCEYIV